jgi:hypothetical protein
MGQLGKPRHERFAQLMARGRTGEESYIEVFGQAKGARVSAARLLTNATISLRIAELKAQISAELLQTSILDATKRLKGLENRYILLNQAVDARAAEHRAFTELIEMAVLGPDPEPTDAPPPVEPEKFQAWRLKYPVLAWKVRNNRYSLAAIADGLAPGGETGWVLRDYRGKNAERVIFKNDNSTAAELRAIEESAARQLGQLNPETGPGGATGVGSVEININFLA